MYPAPLLAITAKLLALAKARGIMLTTAESCTGGLLAGLLTEMAGSSSVFERGFVTYSNDAKISLLGVAPELIATHGAVSLDCARAMAVGALANSAAQIALSITGVAGPDGGSPQKPVGFVCFGVATKAQEPQAFSRNFGNLGRSHVRLASLNTALDALIHAVEHA